MSNATHWFAGFAPWYVRGLAGVFGAIVALTACQPIARVPATSSPAPSVVSTATPTAGRGSETKLLPGIELGEGANANLRSRAPFMELTRIGLGSCADSERPQPIWDAVLAFKPQLFLFAGDNVYGDRRGGKYVPDAELVGSLKDAYKNAAAIPGFVALRNTVPYLATWDDHDYGKNDAGIELPHKNLSQQIFLEFWAATANDPRRSREGIYDAWSFGPPGRRVQVILLDTRFFRSPLKTVSVRVPGSGPYLADDDTSKTVLGDVQWTWLREQLLQPADVRLVVSSIQVLATGHQWERWETMPHERRRLFDLIRETRAAGVVFLSGDRHFGALYRQDPDTPYPLLEMTSSGLTQSFPNNREPGPNRLGDVYGRPNFGAIEIDWAARTLSLSVRSVSGEVVRSVQVVLNDLQPERR